MSTNEATNKEIGNLEHITQLTKQAEEQARVLAMLIAHTDNYEELKPVAQRYLELIELRNVLFTGVIDG